MKTLLPEFTKSGWRHLCVWRDDNYAIYKRWKGDGVKPAPHFEAIRIQQNEANERFGVHFEACESYPGKSSWGRHGFTLHSLEVAQAKIEELRQIDAAKKQAGQAEETSDEIEEDEE